MMHPRSALTERRRFHPKLKTHVTAQHVSAEPLHTAGHAHNSYTISLRTHSHLNGSTRLEIKSNKAFSRATDIKFTFVKMI